MTEPELTRQQISDAVSDLGWRYILGALRTSVPVDSMDQAIAVVGSAAATAGPDADEHLWIDVRHDRVVLSVQTLVTASITRQDIALASQLSSAVTDLGLRPQPFVGHDVHRSDQILEIAIDALEIATIRPFWKAVMGYVDEADRTGPEDALVDPVGQGPAIWFQQMDAPRSQRNRIHFDISVPHDEAEHRIAAALVAGGTLLSDAQTPAFWVLADPEGNEACVTTWQGRDSPPT